LTRRAPKIVAFAGSTRAQSLNRRLLERVAAAAGAAGGAVTVLDLAGHPLPLYAGDQEEASGIPDSVRRLRGALSACDGWLIATPEHNGAMPALLKNVIDWTSRPDGDAAVRAAFAGKVAALVAASPTATGGMRALSMLGGVLNGMGVLVLPQPVAVTNADRAFDARGELHDQVLAARVDAVGRGLVEFLIRTGTP
jgi:NAD(P)H-dependent FMN reductase